MLSLGGVSQRKGQCLAKVDTFDAGTRYYIVGPPRGDDEQQAYSDLSYIRAAAEGAPTRAHGLRAMQLAAKCLRDEVQGGAGTGPVHRAQVRKWGLFGPTSTFMVAFRAYRPSPPGRGQLLLTNWDR